MSVEYNKCVHVYKPVGVFEWLDKMVHGITKAMQDITTSADDLSCFVSEVPKLQSTKTIMKDANQTAVGTKFSPHGIQNRSVNNVFSSLHRREQMIKLATYKKVLQS